MVGGGLYSGGRRWSVLRGGWWSVLRGWEAVCIEGVGGGLH